MEMHQHPMKVQATSAIHQKVLDVCCHETHRRLDVLLQARVHCLPWQPYPRLELVACNQKKRKAKIWPRWVMDMLYAILAIAGAVSPRILRTFVVRDFSDLETPDSWVQNLDLEEEDLATI